ncbi:DNA excision repair protein [Diplocarpon rosae]|nr:DNA excision repair protein [Diplocarpon rosae]
MGVNGLWPILAPSARPTPLPTLNRKRLAVDASIWIYQFLKAVRDKEGNALRNSHVVGFFRRICKLLYFGIKPVFVFDGGAPVLKRQTIQGRKRRREGRREDAVRTAGKLLAVQMKRRGEEEEDRRKRDAKRERDGRPAIQDDEEVVPEDAELVYVGEMGMSSAERNKNRAFRKTDAYHLPELTNGIEGMGQPNDPRIMSAEELEEYARQFHDGEDVNLYDFSKIDFNGDFFLSLPAGDRYNILNAARLRSRMRMGYGQEQLDQMYPNKMDFSKFQIARVMERNELTQRLMNLNGMNDDLPGVGGGRIAGERGREYVLVKNDGVEGGYALGVVSTDKGVGERHKPIDVDAVSKVKVDDSEEEEEFEDVPVEGLNRLPKVSPSMRLNLSYQDFQEREISEQRKRLRGHGQAKGFAQGVFSGDISRAQINAQEQGEDIAESISSEDIPVAQATRNRAASEDPDSLFVGTKRAADFSRHNDLFEEEEEDNINHAIALSLQKNGDEAESDEEQHLNRAIALSLQQNHAQDSESEEEMELHFEDAPMPEYEQRAVKNSKPISSSSGGMIAHIVNSRANAAVPKPKQKTAASDSDSDSDMDMQAALAKARKHKAPERRQPAPVATNKKNPFDGPLPFESLGSIFSKRSKEVPKQSAGSDQDDGLAGGFEKEPVEAPRPQIPWMAAGDIRDQVEVQKKRDQELNEQDREMVDEEEREWRKRNAPIIIESEDEIEDGDSDVEIVDKPGSKPVTPQNLGGVAEDVRAIPPVLDIHSDQSPSVGRVVIGEQREDREDEEVEWSESDYGDAAISRKTVDVSLPAWDRTDVVISRSASPEFENVEIPEPEAEAETYSPAARDPNPVSEDLNAPDPTAAFPSDKPLEPIAPQPQLTAREQAEIDAEFDDMSDDDEELMAQLAEEAEAHAQFASTLNNRTEEENQASYEKELKALRTQQKKDRRDADEVTTVMISECQALLRLFGLPYITAPMEAEAQCAELVNLGLVDGVVTDDCDIFLFGGTRVYKNMFNSNKFVECYLLSDIEKELSLSRDQLIAIAHLLGSDYTDGLPGVGPVTAVEILSEFPSASGLQEFKEWWSTVQVNGPPVNTEPSTFRKKFRRSQATKLFLPPGFPSSAVTEAYLKPDVDNSPDPFQWGVPDLDRLREFLMATIGWTQERTDEVLVPVIRDMNRREQEGTQSNITRFFEGAVGAGAAASSGTGRERVGSKRMKDAVGKLKASKKTQDPLKMTYADVGREWAERNDIGWTEREQEKLWGKKKGGTGTGKGRVRGRKRTTVDLSAGDDEEEAGEGDGRDGHEAHRSSSAGVGSHTAATPKEQGRGTTKPVSKGKGEVSRKRAKV